MPRKDISTPEQQAADWFALMRSSAAAEHRAGFERWQAADPAHAAAYRRVAGLWGDADFTAALFSAAADRGARRSRPAAWPKAVAIAASLLLAAGLGIFAGGWHVDLTAGHVAAAGPPQRFVLADGSVLLLDAGAAADVRYRDDARIVTLHRGRLLAEVRRDPARPFRIEAGGFTAEALGTVYSVSHAPDPDVAVREGRVLVSRDDGTAAELQAGQRLDPDAMRPAAMAAGGFAWSEGRLVFADRPLADVAAELDRYWPGLIWVRGDELQALRVSGSYRLDDPRQVAEALAAAAGAQSSLWAGRLLVLQR